MFSLKNLFTGVETRGSDCPTCSKEEEKAFKGKEKVFKWEESGLKDGNVVKVDWEFDGDLLDRSLKKVEYGMVEVTTDKGCVLDGKDEDTGTSWLQ